MVETKTSWIEGSSSTAARVLTTLTPGKASRAADLVSVAERSKIAERWKCSGRALIKGRWKTAKVRSMSTRQRCNPTRSAEEGVGEGAREFLRGREECRRGGKSCQGCRNGVQGKGVLTCSRHSKAENSDIDGSRHDEAELKQQETSEMQEKERERAWANLS